MFFDARCSFLAAGIRWRRLIEVRLSGPSYLERAAGVLEEPQGITKHEVAARGQMSPDPPRSLHVRVRG